MQNVTNNLYNQKTWNSITFTVLCFFSIHWNTYFIPPTRFYVRFFFFLWALAKVLKDRKWQLSFFQIFKVHSLLITVNMHNCRIRIKDNICGRTEKLLNSYKIHMWEVEVVWCLHCRLFTPEEWRQNSLVDVLCKYGTVLPYYTQKLMPPSTSLLVKQLPRKTIFLDKYWKILNTLWSSVVNNCVHCSFRWFFQ